MVNSVIQNFSFNLHKIPLILERRRRLPSKPFEAGRRDKTTNGMSDFLRVGPQIPRILSGKAVPSGGPAAEGRTVEPVRPVVLDNDVALGFIHERLRRLESETAENSVEREKSAQDAASKDKARSHTADGRVPLDGRHGFGIHLVRPFAGDMAEGAASARHYRAHDYAEISDAYRRAGAEPVLFPQESQLVNLAI